MTFEILLVIGILLVVFGVLVTELIPLEVLALLVLGTLAVTGLVSPVDALSGFSNPAVVTIWAVFILSGGLTRTGIANILGRYLLRIAGGGSAKMIIFIMLIAGVLSAFMNNVAVAALMLPVVMDICRKTKSSPSIMLMPLAYGSLLGGLTTMIGTPPNILVSEALRTNGLTPFGLFDFTPVGIVIMTAGILFVTFIGTRLLPQQNHMRDVNDNNSTTAQYHLEERLFRIKIPHHSALIGKTLAQSHLGATFSLNVVGITRARQTSIAPGKTEIIRANDELIVEGRLERVLEMNNWGQLLTESSDAADLRELGPGMEMAEIALEVQCKFIGKTFSQLNFRNTYNVNVVAVYRDDKSISENMKLLSLKENDRLIVLGTAENIELLVAQPGVQGSVTFNNKAIAQHDLYQKLRVLKIPDNSKLIGQDIHQSRLGDALDIQILAILKENGTAVLPQSDTLFEQGDKLVISGLSDLIAVLLFQGLEAVFVQEQASIDDLSVLEDEQSGIIEVILSPHSNLSGQTLQELQFREKYGLTVLAVWRKGKAIRTGLRDLQLQFGDALLLLGSWKKLAVLGKEPDFIVLTDDVQEPAREDKAATALTVMAAVLIPVIFGWLPIYIAVVIGAAVMILTKCLTMDEAYRFIEWKAVFLIAGMLPLGVALDQTGAAALVAEQTIAVLGPFGPYGVLFGLLVITFIATSIIPTAALVVLMVPIALKTSAGLGISPYPLMMGIAMAASSSFTSPISHPANVLVMGPGGYKFMDYVKVGVPLTLVILVLLMIVIPIFWPLNSL